MRLEQDDRVIGALLTLVETLGGEGAVRLMPDENSCRLYVEPDSVRAQFMLLMQSHFPGAMQKKTGSIQFDNTELAKEGTLTLLQTVAEGLTRHAGVIPYVREIGQAIQALFRKMGGFGEALGVDFADDGIRVSIAASSGHVLALANLLHAHIGGAAQGVVALEQGIMAEGHCLNRMSVMAEHFASPDAVIELQQMVQYFKKPGRVPDFSAGVVAIVLSVSLVFSTGHTKLPRHEARDKSHSLCYLDQGRNTA